MLPIGEMVDVARTVGEDGSSALASWIAGPWDCTRARFLRSSANHVFVCDDGFLRFRPEEAATNLVATVEAANRLTEAVATPLASSDGDLVVLVKAESKIYAAAMFATVVGRQIDEDSLTPELARAWGEALAKLHAAATQLDPLPSLPSWLDTVAEAGASLGREEVVDELRRLPTTDELVGIVHGDPELDNVIWSDDGPVFVDLDDLSRSWFAADVCFALRDFEGSPLADDFVAGYRKSRPLSDEELSWLPLFRRAHALVTLARLEPVLAEAVAEDWPDWAKALHARLHEVAARLRTAVS